MLKKYQVTIFDKTNKYKPVASIVECEDTTPKAEIQKKGVQKICHQKLWTAYDLKKYNYTVAKVREYDIEKIKAENLARYEKIKAEKYASGEWKKPKEKA